MPGAGIAWFADDFRPDEWLYEERWTYLLVEIIPLAIFILVGIIFYITGGRTREHKAVAAPATAAKV